VRDLTADEFIAYLRGTDRFRGELDPATGDVHIFVRTALITEGAYAELPVALKMLRQIMDWITD